MSSSSTSGNRGRNRVSLIAITACIVITAILSAIGIYLLLKDAALLNPAGIIAAKQRDLMLITLLLMLIVVIPVFVLAVIIPIKFREGNKKATYTPDWDHHRGLEFIWWGVPILIIAILGVITWQSSHELDPYKPLDSPTQLIEVQVVATEWKWLFIYPDYGIATVNALHIPEKTPITFSITSDAPMNSFWIPRLGGQVYAMSGMTTKLHLQGDKVGSYEGLSANLSGEGFADMKFKANVQSNNDFVSWVYQTQDSDAALNEASYAELSKKSIETKPRYYRLDDLSLYDKIVMKYMTPTHDHSSRETESTDTHEGMTH